MNIRSTCPCFMPWVGRPQAQAAPEAEIELEAQPLVDEAALQGQAMADPPDPDAPPPLEPMAQAEDHLLDDLQAREEEAMELLVARMGETARTVAPAVIGAASGAAMGFALGGPEAAGSLAWMGGCFGALVGGGCMPDIGDAFGRPHSPDSPVTPPAPLADDPPA
jgi:hypothetical protein